MFREIRKTKKALDNKAAAEMLKTCEYGVLSTSGEDGYAYGVPLNFVYDGNAIYFHCAKQGHKIDNLRFNNKVSFCVVNRAKVLSEEFSTEYQSAVVFGLACEVENNEEKRKALGMLIEKYSSEFMSSGAAYIDRFIDMTSVIKINIEHISAKGKV